MASLLRVLNASRQFVISAVLTGVFPLGVIVQKGATAGTGSGGATPASQSQSQQSQGSANKTPDQTARDAGLPNAKGNTNDFSRYTPGPNNGGVGWTMNATGPGVYSRYQSTESFYNQQKFYSVEIFGKILKVPLNTPYQVTSDGSTTTVTFDFRNVSGNDGKLMYPPGTMVITKDSDGAVTVTVTQNGQLVPKDSSAMFHSDAFPAPATQSTNNAKNGTGAPAPPPTNNVQSSNTPSSFDNSTTTAQNDALDFKHPAANPGNAVVNSRQAYNDARAKGSTVAQATAAAYNTARSFGADQNGATWDSWLPAFADLTRQVQADDAVDDADKTANSYVEAAANSWAASQGNTAAVVAPGNVGASAPVANNVTSGFTIPSGPPPQVIDQPGSQTANGNGQNPNNGANGNSGGASAGAAAGANTGAPNGGAAANQTGGTQAQAQGTKTVEQFAKEAGLPGPTGTTTSGIQTVYGQRVDVGNGATYVVNTNGTVTFTYRSQLGLQAIRVVTKNSDGSVSVRQKVFGLGYNRSDPVRGTIFDNVQTVTHSRTIKNYDYGKQEVVVHVETGYDVTVTVDLPDQHSDGKFTYTVRGKSPSDDPQKPTVYDIHGVIRPETSINQQIEAIIEGLNLPPPPSENESLGTSSFDDDEELLKHLKSISRPPSDSDPPALTCPDYPVTPCEPTNESKTPPEPDIHSSISPSSGASTATVAVANPAAIANAPAIASVGIAADSLLSLTNSTVGVMNTALSGPVAEMSQYEVSSGISIQNAFVEAPHDIQESSRRLPNERIPEGQRSQPAFQTIAFHSRSVVFDFERWIPSPSAAPAAIPERSAGIIYSIVANGKSRGEAFELQMRDPQDQIRKVEIAEGTILEPVKAGSARSVADTANGAPLLRMPLRAFCVDYPKLPPEAGMLYRIAPQSVQDKYHFVRSVLQAARRLGVDDDITQYSVWTAVGDWNEQQFEQRFMEHSEKNAEAMNVKWTPQFEAAVRAVVAERWRMVSMVLQAAAKP